MRPSNRVWVELKKELGRSTNLVWVAALLIWLALSTSRYSHWHSHILHGTWLSGTHNTQLTHYQRSSSFASWAPLLELNGTHMDIDQRTEFTGLQDDSNVPVGYIYDNDYGEVNGTQSQNQEDISSTVSPRLYEAPYPHTDNDGAALINAGHMHNLDSEESVNERQVHNELQVVETVRDQSRFEPTSSQDSYEFLNAHARGSPSKSCATVEEMGLVAANTFTDSSLQVRKMIEAYFSQHGASHVRELPAKEFCQKGFVFGRAAEDGLGNDIYKILTAAGLSIMLNRSLIVAEHGSTNPAYFGLAGHVRLPFGDYLKYSNQTFSLSEVKRLWVKHDCAGEHKRPLTMVVDDFQRPTRTKVFCEDWAKWRHPII